MAHGNQYHFGAYFVLVSLVIVALSTFAITPAFSPALESLVATRRHLSSQHRPCSCHRGSCVDAGCNCVRAYTGPNCSIGRALLDGFSIAFSGPLTLTAPDVLVRGGVFLDDHLRARSSSASDTAESAGALLALKNHSLPRIQAALSTSAEDDAAMVEALQEGNLEKMPVQLTPSLLQLLPPRDPLSALPPFESCAVVGNSGISRLHARGAEIDAHACVVRFNSAPTTPAFRAHVGERTCLRLVNTAHAHAGTPEPGGGGMELRIQQLQTWRALAHYLQLRHWESVNRSSPPAPPALAFSPAFTQFVSRGRRMLPTGGLYGVILAMQKCLNVTLFGFYWRAGDMTVSHHYFDNEEPRAGEAAIHDYEWERRFLQACVHAGLIRVGQPCALGCEAEGGGPCHACAPGSTCACGLQGPPTPVALPGYCHASRNFTCYLRCPECKGGPEGSKCPSRILSSAAGMECEQGSNVNIDLDNKPWWMSATPSLNTTGDLDELLMALA